MLPRPAVPGSIESALLSLEGLSVGDAFGASLGELSGAPTAIPSESERVLPAEPWQWTDDTHMALSVVEILGQYDEINQDALAELFAERFSAEPFRGYGRGAAWVLSQLAEGASWRKISPQVFASGSYGNGAAMRAAPIGGYFRGQPERAAGEARKSAVITHAHPDGQAGAIAVAVAAAIAAGGNVPQGRAFLEQVLLHVPASEVGDGIQEALGIEPDDFDAAVRRLGTGWAVSAQDTVPFCLWVAAHNLASFENALWQTMAGSGDRDTTCAIVGGIVALSSGNVPQEWVARREPFPDDFA